MTHPTIAEMASHFASSVSKWAEGGFAVVSNDDYKARHSACESCSEYVKVRGLWHGCRLCGCSRFRLFLETEVCQLGKWPFLK